MNVLEDKILVEPDAPVTETASGLVVPDIAVEKPNRGTVRAVGGGIPDYPMILKIGDAVYFNRAVGNEFSIEGKRMLIMRQSDILAYETD